MRLCRENSYEKMCSRAADIIASQINHKPNCTLGMATGSSVIGIYKNLVNLYNEKNLDFSQVCTVNLDEYVGLPADNKQSYRYFMDTNLFDFVNVNKENTYVPNGLAEDIEEHCKEYDEKIEELGGVDLQILGIGNNGHIGFNEPGSCFAKKTHRVELSRSTVNANSRFFENDTDNVPQFAISMGIDSIFSAKQIVLVAGKEKYDILKKAIRGPITPEIPASILQLHPNVMVVYESESDI